MRIGMGIRRVASAALLGSMISCDLGPLSVAEAAAFQDLPPWAQVRRPPARRALIFGIGAYDNATQLSTPNHDATLMAGALAELNFTASSVVKGRIGRDAMLEAIDTFSQTLSEGDIAVVYFSGHGLQRDGVNYLVPSDATNDFDRPGHVYVSLDYLLEKLEEAKVAAAVIVLDACRTDPFIGPMDETRDILTLSSAQRTTVVAVPQSPAPFAEPSLPEAPPPEDASLSSVGLAIAPDLPTPFLIAYAAQPQRPAFSLIRGEQPTAGSIYSRTVARRIRDMRQHPMREILGMAESDVETATERAQKPYQSSFALGYLLLSANTWIEGMEQEAWVLSVANATAAQEPEFLRRFLHLYPTSEFAYAARQRLAQLGTGLAAVTESQAVHADLATTVLQIVGFLQSIRAEADGTVIAAANVDVPVRRNWNTILKSQQVGTLRPGEQVTVIEAARGDRAAKVLTEDGLVGFVGGVTLVRAADVRNTIPLTFSGSDASADVADWSALLSARPELLHPQSVVTVRTGPAAEGGEASEQVAHLRALRIRGVLLEQGMPPERINLVTNVGELAKDTAEVAIARAGSRP